MSTSLRRTAAGFAAVALLLFAGALPAKALSNTTAANAAATWLVAQRASDGSVDFGYQQFADNTTEALIGIAAATDPTLQSGIDAMLAYVKTAAPTYGSQVMGAAKLAVLASAYGHDVSSYFGVNAVSVINAAVTSNGTFGKGAFGDAWILIGLQRAGGTPTSAMCDGLAGQQDASGAFGYIAGGFNADIDITGLAATALSICQTTAAKSALAKAITWLDGQQQSDGSWPNPYSPVNTTALAAMSKIAVGSPSTTALNWLVSQQAADGGLSYGGSSDPYATAQALPVLGGKSYLTVVWTPATPIPTVTATATTTTTATATATATATTVVPGPTSTVSVASAARTVQAVTTATATVTVTATPTPSAVPTDASPAPTVTVTATQTVTATPTAVAVSASASGTNDLPWYIAGGTMLGLAGVGGLVLWRRGA